ncbi:PRPF19 [Acanthosepion pharaonis]|uniref:Pre-mRNA-processing factor 19 n=1 Tax=Acanthosepion pharaonis TaxID=158019 RepID=A0A812CYT5_ACAPH|nr:PRPF19 [Sepia pharaonis]
MALCCAISNETPEHPCISPVSGHIFERRLLEKYIQENGTDPMNGEKLTVDVLVDVKASPLIKPRPPSATSIPAILKSLQDEWDAVMLHSFTLRQQLQTARQELSHALYQHDAACRVIARLTKEVTAAREGLANSEDIRVYRQLASHTGLHSASVPGILSLDICLRDTSKIVTGGNDKNAVVFNKDTEQVMAILKGHTKKVTSVIYHPEEELVFTASPDSSIRVWGIQTAQCAQVIRAHEAPVTGLSLHATGDYLLSSSTDTHWAFSDIRTGKVLTKVTDSSAPHALTCAQFHPDGLIFGTGTEDCMIKIWDLKEQINVANFPGHMGPITSIAFSENGYYLATAAEDAVVKLWDLRKLKNFKTIQLDDKYEVRSLCFDQSGTYLAVAGTDVRIYLCKQWQDLAVFNDHTAAATGVRFGHNATFVASASMDRSVKFFGMS